MGGRVVGWKDARPRMQDRTGSKTVEITYAAAKNARDDDHDDVKVDT